jgi:hypothetical protein
MVSFYMKIREKHAFKKFFVKTILKSKINLIRKVVNVVSIQWNYSICRPPQSREPFPLNARYVGIFFPVSSNSDTILKRDANPW